MINVPVYINKHGQYNRVFVDINKIATVFGRDNFYDYINRELKKGNLLRVKIKGNQVSERPALIAGGYNEETSIDSIRPTTEKSQQKFSITEEIPKKKRSSKSKADLESLYATELNNAPFLEYYSSLVNCVFFSFCTPVRFFSFCFFLFGYFC